ncbi:tyrosine-type recombinase/integrase [Methylocystis parvus]|uniref:tyrosine-type recombinase/integrase n=1 Tax=Methylocystis parvus TaxID=134 RepID=UPI003C7829DF
MAEKKRLTDAIVKAATLPPGKAEAVLWDSEVTGFGLRLRPQSKSYILSYRPAGAGRSSNMKRLKLGTPATIASASEARKLALVALGRILSGADPAAERAEQKRRLKSRVSDLLERYHGELERRGYVNRKTVLSGLRARLAPHLNRDIRDVTGADLAAVIEALEKDGKGGAAEDFRSRCRAFLSWCVVKAKIIEASPLAGFRRERATRADRVAKAQHGRALSDGELASVWKAADPATTFGRLIRFLILTGCRRGEAAGLTWAMVDREARVIRLPAAFVKQGRGHLVPIAPALTAVFEACQEDARSDLVFPSPKTGEQISGWSKILVKTTKAAGVDFSLHDLRRTFRTGLSRLGVDDDTAEIALGRARTNLEAIYNRDDALTALREAFELWAAHVETHAGTSGRE